MASTACVSSDIVGIHAIPRVLEVGAGEHRVHLRDAAARRTCRSRRSARARAGGAAPRRAASPGSCDVVDVAALAADEARVLLAARSRWRAVADHWSRPSQVARRGDVDRPAAPRTSRARAWSCCSRPMPAASTLPHSDAHVVVRARCRGTPAGRDRPGAPSPPSGGTSPARTRRMTIRSRHLRSLASLPVKSLISASSTLDDDALAHRRRLAGDLRRGVDRRRRRRRARTSRRRSRSPGRRCRADLTLQHRAVRRVVALDHLDACP